MTLADELIATARRCRDGSSLLPQSGEFSTLREYLQTVALILANGSGQLQLLAPEIQCSSCLPDDLRIGSPAEALLLETQTELATARARIAELEARTL